MEQVDLDRAMLTVAQQRTTAGEEMVTTTPKARSQGQLLLAEATVGVLRDHLERQEAERLAAGVAWADSGYVFVDEAGVALLPQRLACIRRSFNSNSATRPLWSGWTSTRMCRRPSVARAPVASLGSSSRSAVALSAHRLLLAAIEAHRVQQYVDRTSRYDDPRSHQPRGRFRIDELTAESVCCPRHQCAHRRTSARSVA